MPNELRIEKVGMLGERGLQNLFRSLEKAAGDLFGCGEIASLERGKDLFLILDAIGHGCEDSFALFRPANEVEREKRDNRSFDCLLKVFVAGEFPNPATKCEMTFEE